MNDISRRKILGLSAAALIVGPAQVLSSRLAVAADMPKVDPNDPQAKGLKYVEKSTEGDNHCGNCQLYTGDPTAEWGTCQIFPGKQVANAGWCTAWVIKAG